MRYRGTNRREGALDQLSVHRVQLAKAGFYPTLPPGGVLAHTGGWGDMK